MSYTHIIFDIDGTMLDTEEAVLLSLQQTVKQVLHRTMTFDELRFSLGIPGKDTLHKLDIRETDTTMELWDGLFHRYFDRVRVFDGIPDLLKRLKEQGYRLGVITSKTEKEYQNDFIPFGLAGYFDIVICAEHTACHKPHPEPMCAYLKRAEIAPAQALYIGDTVYDFQCAQGAGVDFALALWGCRQPEGIKGRFALASPGQVLEVLG